MLYVCATPIYYYTIVVTAAPQRQTNLLIELLLYYSQSHARTACFLFIFLKVCILCTYIHIYVGIHIECSFYAQTVMRRPPHMRKSNVILFKSGNDNVHTKSSFACLHIRFVRRSHSLITGEHFYVSLVLATVFKNVSR